MHHLKDVEEPTSLLEHSNDLQPNLATSKENPTLSPPNTKHNLDLPIICRKRTGTCSCIQFLNLSPVKFSSCKLFIIEIALCNPISKFYFIFNKSYFTSLYDSGYHGSKLNHYGLV